ncbi:MAG: hypothetical protein A2Z72_04640 [Omnitrophica bacterium RBG_13_46_9]|nr:MAG: hypothetical protein A2Z72_04640 [Omnitrophica bacterium RBG_13_46_9]
MKNKEIALMYSGGLDTTYAALTLAETFSKVHLLTFCNGVCLRPRASRKHFSMLREKFGRDKFEHTVIPIAHIFAFLRKNIIKDMLKYRSPLLFDLCCRLSMEIATILYCMDKRVSYATDGSNPRTQGQMFIQQEGYLKLVDKFFSRYGIESVRSYNMLCSRDEIRQRLRDKGINTEVRWLRFLGISTQLFTQPFCLWAPVAFLFTSATRKIPLIRYFSLSQEKAIIYRMEKEKLAQRFIEYLRYNYSLSHEKNCIKRVSRLFRCMPSTKNEQ